METKIVAGGVLEKNGRFLLVQETKKEHEGKWNLPAGGLEENESIIECAKREIIEEAGFSVEITGLLGIIHKLLNGVNIVSFFFDTKIISENVNINSEDKLIQDWFTYEELVNMKEELRAGGYFLNAVKNKVDDKIMPLEVISVIRK